ncbi:methyl-accepting chemotaxis protein [Caenispirillum bisanense]|uniref:Methyl-accepting chemotaxis protein n=1 Tax=Caenispirillum bisanense TaxID=414052 RepID=A0A286GZH0_9PROT|nr:methyl-accepting chemotaxis protein [Caenispirillum bisanense]SOE00930.1 Methyl-accepting chemotaxis protein [Caenispirillum bisanense]
MKALLSRGRIRTRIAVAVLVPILGLLAFAVLQSARSYQAMTEASRLQEVAGVAPAVSAVVHELQKERGATAGFLAARSDEFRTLLDNQRRLSDKAITTLLAQFQILAADTDDRVLRDQVTKDVARLGDLAATRRAVDGGGIETPAAIGWYTATIAGNLDVIARMAAVSTNAGVTRSVAAYVAYLQAKERAGIERATGAAGFGAGAFNPALHERFVALIGAQGAFLATFQAFAEDGWKTAAAAVADSPAAKDVERMRRVGIESMGAATTGIEGPAWFKAATARIDLMKGVEDTIAADLTGRLAGLSAVARNTFAATLAVSVALLAVTLVLVTVIVRGIVGPVRALTDEMKRLADGDTSMVPAGLDREDEVGDMARAVEVFRDHMIRADQLAADQRREQEARAARAAHIEALTADFDSAVSALLDTVAGAANELETTAESMSAIAEETSRQAVAVSAAAEEASANVETVAASAEELHASSAEIGRRVTESSEVSRRAAAQAEETATVVSHLSDSAQKIGEVVGLIADIADQTNLLALNATIEAARAGDAGKGFAVVASEVKQLAGQTAKATEDISRQITDVQSATTHAVEAIGAIGGMVREVDHAASAIASAVEEQNAATAEIARNIAQASQGAGDVSANIGGVTAAASEAGQAASGVLHASERLTRDSGALRETVRRFLMEVRAA